MPPEIPHETSRDKLILWPYKCSVSISLDLLTVLREAYIFH